MATGSVQNFSCGIDVNVPLPKVRLSKTTGHITSTFQNYGLSVPLLTLLLQYYGTPDTSEKLDIDGSFFLVFTLTENPEFYDLEMFLSNILISVT